MHIVFMKYFGPNKPNIIPEIIEISIKLDITFPITNLFRRSIPIKLLLKEFKTVSELVLKIEYSIFIKWLIISLLKFTMISFETLFRRMLRYSRNKDPKMRIRPYETMYRIGVLTGIVLNSRTEFIPSFRKYGDYLFFELKLKFKNLNYFGKK